MRTSNESATVWMVLDIGNSVVKGGLFEDDVLRRTFRAPHEAADLAAILRSEVDTYSIQRAGIASVVPRSTATAARVLADAGIAVTHVRPTMRLPFELAYRTPDTLGTDRLAAAAAAWLQYGRREGRDVVVLDAGTAVTCEVIERTGVYRGGTIAPGPMLMRQVLNRETAQLPDVPLSLPTEPIGGSTTEAIQAGVMYGFIDSVRGLLQRINETLQREAFVVATGGWSSLLKGQIADVDAVSPHLVLEGVRCLLEMNE